jgi:hypothetical protein
LQWLQNQRQGNVNNMNSFICETSRTSRKKRKRELENISDFETNCKKKHQNIIHKSRINKVKDDINYLFADSHGILSR